MKQVDGESNDYAFYLVLLFFLHFPTEEGWGHVHNWREKFPAPGP